MKKLIIVCSLLILVLTFAACGGGGGGTSTPTMTLSKTTFTNLCAVTTSDTYVQSPDAITVTNITSVDVSISSGGQFSKDGGSTWLTNGTINNGDSVIVRPTGGIISSNTSAITLTLTIDTTPVEFIVTPGPCGQSTTTSPGFVHLPS